MRGVKKWWSRRRVRGVREWVSKKVGLSESGGSGERENDWGE